MAVDFVFGYLANSQAAPPGIAVGLFAHLFSVHAVRLSALFITWILARLCLQAVYESEDAEKRRGLFMKRRYRSAFSGDLVGC